MRDSTFYRASFSKLFFVLGLFSFYSAFAEGPSIPEDSEGYLIHHNYYSLSYSDEFEQAEWVSYELTSTMLEGRTRRRNNFTTDPVVSDNFDDPVRPNDYRGSGFSRGHLVPAGDMKVNRLAMDETFYMSNMSPQRSGFNSGIWNKLENQVREWTREKGKLYIVSGPILERGLPTIESGVAIPEYYYKILFYENSRHRNESKMIAFLMRNEYSRRDIQDFVVSVDEIEDHTGIDFFPELGLRQEEFLESNILTDFWFENNVDRFRFNPLGGLLNPLSDLRSSFGLE